MSSFLPPPQKRLSYKCAVLVQHWSLFPLFPKDLTQMSFHTSFQLDQRSWTQHSQVSLLYSMFWVCPDLTHQFVWFVAVWSSVGGCLKTRAWRWHSSRGCNPSFCCHHWARSLQGGRGALCLGTWKAWLTIPFEATGCKGAGHWQVRTKMGLIVKETPREDCAGLGATRTLSSSLSTHWALFNQRPSGESRY